MHKASFGSSLTLKSWFCKWIIINSTNFWSGIRRELHNNSLLDNLRYVGMKCFPFSLPNLCVKIAAYFPGKALKFTPLQYLKMRLNGPKLSFISLYVFYNSRDMRKQTQSSENILHRCLLVFYCARCPAVLIHYHPLEIGNAIFIPIGLITLQFQRPSAWKQTSISQKWLCGAWLCLPPPTAQSNLDCFSHIELFKVEPSIKSWRKSFPVTSLTL